MHGLLQVLIVFRADMERGQRIDPACQPNEKTGKQGDKNAGRAYGSQSDGTCEFAHDCDIRHIE